jgi:hypothetical protein
MFGDNVTKRLLSIQNEQRAQKTASSLNYGQLVTPEKTPQQTYSGNVANLVDFDSGVNARWVATFTRTDGVDGAPFVMFPYDYTLGMYLYDDYIVNGYFSSVSARDKRAVDEYNFFDELFEVGSNYVKWKIEIGNQYFYNSSNGTNVTIVVQAVTMVPGTLTLQRVI